MTVICVFEEGVVGGHASNHPLLSPTSLKVCHSERSEESRNFSRTLMKIIINIRIIFIVIQYAIVIFDLTSSRNSSTCLSGNQRTSYRKPQAEGRRLVEGDALKQIYTLHDNFVT